MHIFKITVILLLKCYTFKDIIPSDTKTSTSNLSDNYFGPENVLDKIPSEENIHYDSKSVDDKMLEAAKNIKDEFKSLERETLNLDTDTSTNLKVSHAKLEHKKNSESKNPVEMFSNEELNNLPKETITQFRVPDTIQADIDDNPFLQNLKEINEKSKTNLSKSFAIEELMKNNEGYLRDQCLIERLKKQKGTCKEQNKLQNLGENIMNIEKESVYGKRDILKKNPDILEELKSENKKHLDKEPRTSILDKEEIEIREENGNISRSLFESTDKKLLSDSADSNLNSKNKSPNPLNQSDILNVAEKIARQKADIASKRFTEFTGGLEDPEKESGFDKAEDKEDFVNEPIVRGNFDVDSNPKVNYQSLKEAKKSKYLNKIHDGEDGSNFLAARALSLYDAVGEQDESAKKALDKLAIDSGLGDESSKNYHEKEKKLNARMFLEDQNNTV